MNINSKNVVASIKHEESWFHHLYEPKVALAMAAYTAGSLAVSVAALVILAIRPIPGLESFASLFTGLSYATSVLLCVLGALHVYFLVRHPGIL